MAKSVLSSILVYTMHTYLLPKGTCDELDKVIRNFVWNGNDGKMRVHLIDWKTLCMPRKYGGAGLRNFHDVNLAVIAKLAWKFLHEIELPWVKVLREKYLRNSLPHRGEVKPYDSHVWKHIMVGMEIVLQGSKICIGGGPL